MRVLMLVATPVANDTRVLREASALVRAGHPVHVIGLGVPAGFVPPDGVTVSSAGRRPRASRAAAPGARVQLPPPGTRPVRPRWWRLARWLLLPEHRARVFGRWVREAYADASGRAFDVVHAHDFNTLVLGDRLAREHDAALVYDSHELWFGRPVVGRPTPLHDARGRRTEARLGARAAAVITVGEGVAEVLEDTYGWRDVRVVRNTFAPLPPPERPLLPTRLLYAGRLAPYRELEVVAAASADLPLPVDIVGPADETWLRDFDPGAARVLGAIPAGEVSWLLRGAGVALVTHSDRWPNHRLAMPNKLFQAVAAGVPVVATDVGELATLVRGYRLGALYRPGDPASLAAAVADVLAGYDRYAAAVRVAAAALTWPADERMLLDVYTGLAHRPDHLTRSHLP